MANTLTGLIPSLYANLDVVSRELIGAIPSVTRDFSADRAAVGQPVISGIAPAAAGTAITPGVTPPDDGDQSIGSEQVVIDTTWRVPFRWTGEDELGMNNNGPGVGTIQANQMQQAFRTIVNKMEASVIAAAVKGASRAFGTVNTVPFTTDLTEAAEIRKILDDNGAPGARSLIIDTATGVKLRKLTQLTKANEAGTNMTLRDGELLDLFGLSVKESAGIAKTAVGTSPSGYTSDTAGHPVGTTLIPLITGTGTLIAGDIITFAGDANKYVIKTGITAPGTIEIASPGLRVALAASAVAVTQIATGNRLVAFAQSAIVLAARAPAMPSGGDLARDRVMITDPRSGLSFEVSMYPQYHQMQYEVAAVWGSACIKRDHCAVLLS